MTKEVGPAMPAGIDCHTWPHWIYFPKAIHQSLLSRMQEGRPGWQRAKASSPRKTF